MRGSSHQGTKTLKTTGVWLCGGLTVRCALGKGLGFWEWSWGHVALPMLIFLGLWCINTRKLLNLLLLYIVLRKN
jgi:hypothetical protein